MDLGRINYEPGVMFVFRGRHNGKLYTVGIHPKETYATGYRGCTADSRNYDYNVARLQDSAERKYDAGLLLGYYTPDGSVHTYDDGNEDAMFDRLAAIREYMPNAEERDITTLREADETRTGHELPLERLPEKYVPYDYPKYDFQK
jgi:hypothetical protein